MVALSLCVNLTTSAVADEVADKLRDLAERIPYLNAAECSYDRRPDRRANGLPLTADDRATFDEFWQFGHSVTLEELSESVHHDDPKVRTLAMVASYWNDRPAIFLPVARDMINDRAASFPSPPMMMSAFPPPSEPIVLEDQTVGDFAHEVVRRYLSAAGPYNLEGTGGYRSFDDYWEERKDLAYCPSWFRTHFQRASQMRSPVREDRIDDIRAVRANIDRIPSPDREWTLLSLAAPYDWGNEPSPGADILAPESDLVEAIRLLGRYRLLEFLRRERISEHPDFQLDHRQQVSVFGYDRVARFILRHAGSVFTAEDAEVLLEIGAQQPIRKENHEFHLVTTRWAIAAADLVPERAGEILRNARPLFAEGEYTQDQDDRALLAIALWEHLENEAIPEVAEWFFSETGSLGAIGFGRQRLCGYLHQPSSRSLLMALLNDERLAELDWQTLERLVRAANAQSDEPVVAEDVLQRAWHPLGIGHYHHERDQAQRAYPNETAELERNLAMWRERLRAFAASSE